MNEDERSKAVALATAIEALSTSHAKVLAAELRALLEAASIAADPQIVEIDNSQVEPPSSSRTGLSMTPDAVRARAKRAAAAALRRKGTTPPARVVDDRQVELPFGPPSTPVATAVATGRDRSASLSDLNPNNTERDDGRRSVGRVRLDPQSIPASCVEIAKRTRPELGAEVLARSWWRFAKAKADRFRTVDAMEAAWDGWIASERAPTPAPGPTLAVVPGTPPAPAESGAQAVQPAHRESSELFAEHDAQELEAASLEEQRAASAKIAAGLFTIGGRRPGRDPPEPRAMSA